MPNAPSVIGRVVATELKPSTPHQFFFWTARSAPVGIGALVRVEGDGRIVYGVVTDAYAYSDLASPLDAVVGAGGGPRQHHRRQRPRHQDFGRAIPAGEPVPALPRREGPDRGGVLQREGPGPLLPGSARGAGGGRPPRLSAVRHRGGALPPSA